MNIFLFHEYFIKYIINNCNKYLIESEMTFDETMLKVENQITIVYFKLNLAFLNQ